MFLNFVKQTKLIIKKEIYYIFSFRNKIIRDINNYHQISFKKNTLYHELRLRSRMSLEIEMDVKSMFSYPNDLRNLLFSISCLIHLCRGPVNQYFSGAGNPNLSFLQRTESGR